MLYCTCMCRVAIAPDSVMIQVFQSTELVIPAPATRGERFVICLDRVAIKEGGVRGVLLCVQDFDRSPQFLREASSRSPDRQCSLSRWPLPIASRQVPCMLCEAL